MNKKDVSIMIWIYRQKINPKTNDNYTKHEARETVLNNEKQMVKQSRVNKKIVYDKALLKKFTNERILSSLATCKFCFIPFLPKVIFRKDIAKQARQKLEQF